MTVKFCVCNSLLFSFHSKIMTLLPVDIISTGTPRATKISNGNIIECRISGMYSLSNRVVSRVE